MTKKLSIAGLVVAAAASSAIAFGAAPAKAACIGGNNPCTTFDTNLTASPTSVQIGTGTNTGTAFTNLRIGFYTTGITPSVNTFDITSISVSSSYLTSNPLTIAGPLSLNTATNINTNTAVYSAPDAGPWAAITVPGNNFDWSNIAVSFTIPAGVQPAGAKVFAVVQVDDGSFDGNNTLTKVRSFTAANQSSAAAPGPLPLLGAGAAFGFSRRLRKQIKQVA